MNSLLSISYEPKIYSSFPVCSSKMSEKTPTLPLDVWTIIFQILPVKNLIAARTVTKLWNMCISKEINFRFHKYLEWLSIYNESTCQKMQYVEVMSGKHVDWESVCQNETKLDRKIQNGLEIKNQKSLLNGYSSCLLFRDNLIAINGNTLQLIDTKTSEVKDTIETTDFKIFQWNVISERLFIAFNDNHTLCQVWELCCALDSEMKFNLPNFENLVFLEAKDNQAIFCQKEQELLVLTFFDFVSFKIAKTLKVDLKFFKHEIENVEVITFTNNFIHFQFERCDGKEYRSVYDLNKSVFHTFKEQIVGLTDNFVFLNDPENNTSSIVSLNDPFSKRILNKMSACFAAANGNIAFIIDKSELHLVSLKDSERISKIDLEGEVIRAKFLRTTSEILILNYRTPPYVAHALFLDLRDQKNPIIIKKINADQITSATDSIFLEDKSSSNSILISYSTDSEEEKRQWKLHRTEPMILKQK